MNSVKSGVKYAQVTGHGSVTSVLFVSAVALSFVPVIWYSWKTVLSTYTIWNQRVHPSQQPSYSAPTLLLQHLLDNTEHCKFVLFLKEKKKKGIRITLSWKQPFPKFPLMPKTFCVPCFPFVCFWSLWGKSAFQTCTAGAICVLPQAGGGFFPASDTLHMHPQNRICSYDAANNRLIELTCGDEISPFFGEYL